MTPAGGSRPLFGTNPIAFGWPRPNRPPFLFDMATSATARGEIELHRRTGTRCLKAGALIRQAIRPPMPPACWRAQC